MSNKQQNKREYMTLKIKFKINFPVTVMETSELKDIKIYFNNPLNGSKRNSHFLLNIYNRKKKSKMCWLLYGIDKNILDKNQMIYKISTLTKEYKCSLFQGKWIPHCSTS